MNRPILPQVEANQYPNVMIIDGTINAESISGLWPKPNSESV